jgi:8-oxo-dGTP pyrophosphatase MutT (NUDIX family)
MAEEKSCGIVLYYKKGKDIEYLLLHQTQGHYSFPKGHQEKGENDEETAVRELEEESGIKKEDIIFEKEFKTFMKYSFKHGNEIIFKIVNFFLAKSKTKKIKLSGEHTDFLWLHYEEALKKLEFENSKLILKKANSYLVKKK